MGRPRKKVPEIVEEKLKIAHELVRDEVAKMANSQLDDALVQVMKPNYRNFINQETGDDSSVKLIYDCYKAELITKKDWEEYLIAVLMNYIKAFIMEKKRYQLGIEMNDLIMDGVLAIAEKSDVYDPTQAKPTTYFVKYIDQFTKPSEEITAKTTHYNAKANKLRKIALDNGFSGLDDSRLTPEYLSTISGIPLTTVIKTLESNKTKRVSLEAIQENGDVMTSKFETPEEAMLKKEQHDFLMKHVDKLTPLQQFVIYHCLLAEDGERMSFKNMIKILNRPEVRERFADEYDNRHAIDTKWVQKIYSQAMMDLRYNPKIADYADCRFKSDFEFEQATEEDIWRTEDRMQCEDIGLVAKVSRKRKPAEEKQGFVDEDENP
ncbi:MAG: hypothetical protein K5776_03680 [Lachnospiraceae bacterium]|nr:hypothetical protein [Lachnospiraceae bacterium]